MITTGSKHPDAAWEFIKFITSQPVQNQFVADSLPIWSASYSDPAVIQDAAPELVSTAKTQLHDMILRPQVTNYNAASQALQVQIQDALLGRKTPRGGVAGGRIGVHLGRPAAVTGAHPAQAHPPVGTNAEPLRDGGGMTWRARTREGRFALALLAPSIIVVFGIVIYPILKTLYMSLFAVDTPFAGHFPFVGLDNYRFALSQSDFWSAVQRTVYFTFVSTGAELVFGMGIALLLNAPLRARWLFRTIVVLPWALPTIVNGAMWRYFFNAEYGVVNALLTQLGITTSYHSFFSSPFAALNIVVLADVWKNTSLVAFFLLSGLTTIPRDLYEAARVDGYGRLGAFVHITLPLLRPVIVVVLVLRTIEAFKVFDIIYVMTGGGPANGTQSIAYYTYQRAFSDEYFGYGSALAYLIVVFILVLAVIYIRLLRSESNGLA